jgi:hypothetical protein
MHRLAPFRRIPVQRLSQLEARMQAYYAAVPDYPAFHAPSHHPLEWRHLLNEVRRRNTRGGGGSPWPTWNSGVVVQAFPLGCASNTAPMPPHR